MIKLIFHIFKYGVSSKPLPFFHYSLPWNQSTYLGYFAEMTFDAVNYESYLLVNGVILLFFMFMCYHHQAFYEIFKRSIAEIDCCYDGINFSKKNLCDFIEFHISIKA